MDFRNPKIYKNNDRYERVKQAYYDADLVAALSRKYPALLCEAEKPTEHAERSRKHLELVERYFKDEWNALVEGYSYVANNNKWVFSLLVPKKKEPEGYKAQNPSTTRVDYYTCEQLHEKVAGEHGTFGTMDERLSRVYAQHGEKLNHLTYSTKLGMWCVEVKENRHISESNWWQMAIDKAFDTAEETSPVSTTANDKKVKQPMSYTLTPFLHKGDKCYFLKLEDAPDKEPIAWLWFKKNEPGQILRYGREDGYWCAFAPNVELAKHDMCRPVSWETDWLSGHEGNRSLHYRARSLFMNREVKTIKQAKRYLERSDFWTAKDDLTAALVKEGYRLKKTTVNIAKPGHSSRLYRNYDWKRNGNEVLGLSQFRNHKTYGSMKDEGFWSNETKHGNRAATSREEVTEKEIMSNRVPHNRQSTRDMLAKAVTRGTETAVADEAAELLLVFAEQLVGEAYPELAQTDRGRDLVKIVAALALHYASQAYPDVVPQADNVGVACGLVVEASTRDLIQPQLNKLQPIMEKLGQLGAQAAKTEDTGSTSNK